MLLAAFFMANALGCVYLLVDGPWPWNAVALVDQCLVGLWVRRAPLPSSGAARR